MRLLFAVLGLLLPAVLPTACLADAVLNECSQPALESALAVGGVITVNCDGTLGLTNTLTISSDAILDATGHRLTILALNDTNTSPFRLFNVKPGVSFGLINLQLTGGRGTNGGAIYNNRGFLSLDTCLVSNNVATGLSGRDGGRGRNSDYQVGAGGRAGSNGRSALGGAIYSLHGTTLVTRCTFLTNAANAGSGGNGGDGGNGRAGGGNGGKGGSGAIAQGGAIYNSGRLEIDTCSFMLNGVTGGDGGSGGTNGTGFYDGNAGHGGAGGLAGGGAIYNVAGGTLKVLNSTFAMNGARAGDSASAGYEVPRARTGKNGPSCVGGAIANYGSGILVNSTFFANLAVAGAAGNGAGSTIQGGDGGNGGAAWGGNVYNAKRTAVTNCTFVEGGAIGGTNGLGGSATVNGDRGRRGASRGGNVANGNGNFTLKNSLIAFAFPGTNGYGAFTDAGHNLSSDRSIRLKGAGSRTNTDPRIDILGPNGGPTETVPLLSDSPAIDAGDPAGAVDADQRGVPRPLGTRNDIGAYEFGRTLLPPVITSQPQSQIAQAGATISFIVVVDGDPPLTYLWRRAGNAIPSATGPVLTLNNVQAADATTYDVVVANNSGSVTSTNASLTLIGAVAISTQPTNTTVAQGATATLRVAAGGDGPLSYQWIFNRTNFIPGATLNSFMLPNVATNQAGEYSVRVSNPFSSVTSAVAVLTVTTFAPQIVTQPQDITVLPDTSALFTVEVAGGSLPLQYLWFHNGTNLVGSFLLNSNRSTLVIPSAQPADAGLYHVVITNIAGSVTSATAALAVAAFPPVISQQPTNLTVPQGQIATFRVSAAGTTPLYYQWFFNGTTPIPGGTGPVLTIPNVGDSDAGSYSAVVSNRFGAVTSDAATLTVTFAPPEITTQPTNLTVFSGENATFTVAVTGSLPLTYQWFHLNLPIPGANGSSLTISNANSMTDGGEYFVNIANPAGSTNSDVITLEVDDAAPEIVFQPTNGAAFLGSNVSFSVTATNSLPLFYQWFFEDVAIPDATNATLVLSNLTLADSGDYHVTITNAFGSMDSDVATLKLLVPSTFSCTTDDPPLCTITFDSEVGADYTLEWFNPQTQTWEPTTEAVLTGDGTRMHFTNTPETESPQYRVVVEPIPGP